jgi:hypothetical protein
MRFTMFGRMVRMSNVVIAIVLYCQTGIFKPRDCNNVMLDCIYRQLKSHNTLSEDVALRICLDHSRLNYKGK